MGSCKSAAAQKVSPEKNLDRRSLEEVFDAAQLLAGSGEALEFCSEERLGDVKAVISSEEKISQALGLKILERKRLLLSLGMNRDMGFDAVPAPPALASFAEVSKDINQSLRIRMLSGSVLEISMKSSDNVLAAKTRLRESDVFLKDKQFSLISHGHELMNKWSLGDCGLTRDTEVHLSLRQACEVELEGFVSLLQQSELMRYLPEFSYFLARFGAVHLNEVRENAEQLADFVGLRDAERVRFFSALDVEQYLKAKSEKAAEAQFQKRLTEQADVLAPKELEGVYCICARYFICCCACPEVIHEWCYVQPDHNLFVTGYSIDTFYKLQKDTLTVWCICCPSFDYTSPDNTNTWVQYRLQYTHSQKWDKTFHRTSCGITSCEQSVEMNSCGILLCPRYARSVRGVAKEKFQRALYEKAPNQQAMCDMR